MSKDLATVCVSLVLVACTAIVGAVVFHMNDRNNMSKNIEAAIAKGVDPVSVKCAYETNPNATCIAYAFATKK
jgi:pyruvate/oxaloacetate carboxyltransferase